MTYAVHPDIKCTSARALTEDQTFKSPTVIPTPDKSQFVHGIKDVCADDALWLVSAVVQDAMSVLLTESAVKAAAPKEAHTVSAEAADLHRPVAAIQNPEVPAADPDMAIPSRRGTAPRKAWTPCFAVSPR